MARRSSAGRSAWSSCPTARVCGSPPSGWLESTPTRATRRAELLPASTRSLPAARLRCAALLFPCVGTWALRSLLSRKRATQFLYLTRPRAARHLGFNWYRRPSGVDFRGADGRGSGCDSFRVHDECPQKLDTGSSCDRFRSCPLHSPRLSVIRSARATVVAM
jgi:hypothetical protein